MPHCGGCAVLPTSYDCKNLGWMPSIVVAAVVVVLYRMLAHRCTIPTCYLYPVAASSLERPCSVAFGYVMSVPPGPVVFAVLPYCQWLPEP